MIQVGLFPIQKANSAVVDIFKRSWTEKLCWEPPNNMNIMDNVKNLVVLPANADSEKDSQPASLSCLAEAVASLCSYDKIVCTEVMCFKKDYWTSLMGCSIRTVHKKRQPSDQNKRASEIIGTNKRGFRDIFHWKMMGEKKKCYRGWSCEGKERRAGIFVSDCNCPLKTHNRSFPSLGVQITPGNHFWSNLIISCLEYNIRTATDITATWICFWSYTYKQ